MERKVLLAHSKRFGCPEQTYKEHVSEVVRRALESASKVAPYTPFGELFLSTVLAAAEYHDLGKIDEANQKVLRGKTRESLPVDHWDAGTAHLLGKKSIPPAVCVFSHHTGLPSIHEENSKLAYPFRVRTPAKNNKKTVREISDEKLERYINKHEAEMEPCPILPKGLSPGPTFLRFALSCLVDADHTDTARHYNNIIPEGDIPLHPENRLALLDNYVAGLSKDSEGKKLSQRERERNNLRQQVYDSCRNSSPSDKGIITCDSPVGTGKTTAVMAHLLTVAKTKNLRRIFVVLPFTNIIDQSVDTYRKALVLPGENSEKVIAAHHHKAEFEDISSRVFSFLWNAPITVTTAVQFFETLASNNPASLRKLHQLTGSAIFIDEAHAALPAPLWAQALKWLQGLVDDWGCYVVLASGSLNHFWKLKEFSNPPLNNIPELVDDTVRKSALESESIRINYKRKANPLNTGEICDWIKELQGPRLIILNTVHSAASVAKKLSESYGDKRFGFVEHLSTALAPIHRKTILERIKQRLRNPDDNNWTLVATSCVEAGIDFSFRTAAREFCSLVSTIQTAGRINRSGEYGESDLWNFQIVPGDSLKEHPSFTTSARILKQLFDEWELDKGKFVPEYCTEAMKREVREKNQLNADSNLIVIDEQKGDFPSVKDRFKVIDADTVTAIIDREMCERIKRHEKVDFTELQQKSVSIYSNNIKKFALSSLSSLRGFKDLYTWMLDYDSDFLGYMAGVLKLNNDPNNFVV